ncbi:hypothetical protein [Nannocystis bainbridge]|uniref:Uncharacterized protein n=1 Tax=Nannocystis bainbridge TaxID=2995303 RepID=A0ABT5DZF5_9BACT|nr:hypothetical protein [Nannocystis bainbridge]MDC0717841.1 hypothetical protein [Nannocystis bainbridge]
MQDVSQLIADASARDLAPERSIELAHTPLPPVAAALAASERRHPRLYR